MDLFYRVYLKREIYLLQVDICEVLCNVLLNEELSKFWWEEAWIIILMKFVKKNDYEFN